jgi:hypothetical protein
MNNALGRSRSGLPHVIGTIFLSLYLLYYVYPYNELCDYENMRFLMLRFVIIVQYQLFTSSSSCPATNTESQRDTGKIGICLLE